MKAEDSLQVAVDKLASEMDDDLRKNIRPSECVDGNGNETKMSPQMRKIGDESLKQFRQLKGRKIKKIISKCRNAYAKLMDEVRLNV